MNWLVVLVLVLMLATYTAVAEASESARNFYLESLYIYGCVGSFCMLNFLFSANMR